LYHNGFLKKRGFCHLQRRENMINLKRQSNWCSGPRKAAWPLTKGKEEVTMEENGAPKCSFLSKPAILWHLKKGNIIIKPSFNPKSLGEDSYDVRLGEYFYIEQPLRVMDQTVFNPLDPECVALSWGKPRRAILASEWTGGSLKNIRSDRRIIVIGPGEIILAHTEEFIGGRHCVCSEMRTQSTWGRTAINVCRCAGLGHIGFCNRWTMEIHNNYINTPVVLPVGMKIAQITFHETDPLDDDESYARSGRYQTSDNMEEVMKTWAPDQMLPKFKDN